MTPTSSDDLSAYFPGPVVERFGRHLAGHPLRREIIGTIITNDVINSMGITFVARMAAEIGATPDEIVARLPDRPRGQPGPSPLG